MKFSSKTWKTPSAFSVPEYEMVFCDDFFIGRYHKENGMFDAKPAIKFSNDSDIFLNNSESFKTEKEALFYIINQYINFVKKDK